MLRAPLMTADPPRPYYDHEPAYRELRERGGEGWDDRAGAPPSDDSYQGLDELIAGPWLRGRGALAVLDVGTGGGQAALRLAPLARRLVGVDYSPSAIALARNNAADAGVAAEFRVADAASLVELDAGSFNLVLDNHMLHCLVEPEHRAAFLRSARRLLRPAGLLFSETMSRHGELDLTALGIDPQTFVSASGRRFWTSRESLNDELAQAGFTLLEQRYRPQTDRPAAGDLLWTLAQRS